MKTRFLIISILSILTTSWSKIDQDLLYKNYLTAIENQSTIQYFLVITAKDTKTGMSREICTQGNFLHGAIHREYDIPYKDKGIDRVYELLRNNKSRTFEFKNDSALWNLGISDYTIKELKSLETKVDFDALSKQIFRNGSWSKEFPNDDKQMKLYAHALFNRGILTGENNCFGGTLMYINTKEEK